MKAVAVIPARGASKRIPRKNIRAFCGRPMIAWSIAAARDSGCFDGVFVSTDDEETARVAEAHGGEVAFMRPPELADDMTPTVPVIRHAVETLAGLRGMPEAVCCIYATAPFVRADDIRQGLAALRGGAASYVFAVARYAFPIQRALRRFADGSVEMFDSTQFARRSQDLEEAWHDAGQFYWARAATWLAETPVFSRGAIGVALPRHRVQDIDTEEDWRQAELMFRAAAAEGPGR